jgi:hypothetical protein
VAVALWFLTFAIILAIAFVVVRAMADRLGDEPRVAVYSLPEAVEFVAVRLPIDVAGRLTYGEVTVVLEARLDALEAAGAAVAFTDALPAADGDDVIVVEDETLAIVLGRLEARALDVADEDVALILALEADYVRAIGALGGPAEPSGD